MTASRFNPTHPLLADPERLDGIEELMWDTIQKQLWWEVRQRRSSAERTLTGTSVSAEDILAEAREHLLYKDPANLRETWEALAVTIARNKAIDAVRSAQSGLRATEHRAGLMLVSGDLPAVSDSPGSPSILDGYADPTADTEAWVIVQRCLAEMKQLAHELLDERELKVFFDIHFQKKTRRELGEELKLSGQRIGQIYQGAIGKLEAHSRWPFRDDVPKGGKEQ